MEVSAYAIGGRYLEEELKYGEKLLALEACIYHSPHRTAPC